jgi:hypothetical protein
VPQEALQVAPNALTFELDRSEGARSAADGLNLRTNEQHEITTIFVHAGFADHVEGPLASLLKHFVPDEARAIFGIESEENEEYRDIRKWVEGLGVTHFTESAEISLAHQGLEIAQGCF